MEPFTIGATFGVVTEALTKKLRDEPWTRRPYMYPVLAGFWGFVFRQGYGAWDVFKAQSVHQIVKRDELARVYHGT